MRSAHNLFERRIPLSSYINPNKLFHNSFLILFHTIIQEAFHCPQENMICTQNARVISAFGVVSPTTGECVLRSCKLFADFVVDETDKKSTQISLGSHLTKMYRVLLRRACSWITHLF